MQANTQTRPPVGVRYWFSWLVVGLFWVLGRLPPCLGRWLVKPLGPLMFHLMGRRREIARRNIERCFPELETRARTKILHGGFHSLARMLVETAWCWAAPISRVNNMTRIEGIENLQDAEELGRGVLVLTFHSACMEIGGFMLSQNALISGIYRPLKNPVFEWYQNQGRGRYTESMIKKTDALRAIRVLKNGGVLWYAPDQDFGRSRSVFAPFFGIPTATLLATRRLPALTGCAVLPMFPRYDKERGCYVLTLLPALDNFPSDKAVVDLARINAIMEEQVRKVPEQYWWIHRRFKTRPPGEPPFYD